MFCLVHPIGRLKQRVSVLAKRNLTATGSTLTVKEVSHPIAGNGDQTIIRAHKQITSPTFARLKYSKRSGTPDLTIPE